MIKPGAKYFAHSCHTFIATARVCINPILVIHLQTNASLGNLLGTNTLKNASSPPES